MKLNTIFKLSLLTGTWVLVSAMPFLFNEIGWPFVIFFAILLIPSTLLILYDAFNSTPKEKEESSSDEDDSGKNVELRRTCQSCGKVWHVERKEIQELKEKREQNDNNLGVLGAPAAGKMSEKNKEDAIQQLKDLNKCPECRSSNYTEEEVTLDKSKKDSDGEDINNNNETEDSSINYCTECGRELEKDSDYCHNCGSKIDS